MSATLGARNPRLGEVDYWFEPMSADAIAAAAQALREAQAAWADAGLEHRVAVMRRWADAIERDAMAIGRAEFADTGRWRLSHEVPHMVAAGIRGWCQQAGAVIAQAVREGNSSVLPQVSYTTRLHAMPLVGVISPWNHPFLLATLDAIPALLAGSAVLVKPSEIAPRFIDPVEDTLRSVPELAAVLRFVRGGAEAGQAVVHNVDMMCFTGSIATGRLIARECAERMIPVFLELGGKDAALVTEGADLERAATAILKSSVHATGQICFSTERVYVQRSVHDAFVEILCRQSEALELNYPDPCQGHLGPFIDPRQAAIVDAHLDEALAMGATLRCGGRSEVLGGGHYMRPTVLTGVNHQMRVMREETFGPVTPVMAFDTVEEGLRLANDSEYGLSGAVFAATAEEGMALAGRMQAGAVAVQDAALTIAIMRDAEKVSFKRSGLGGSRMGPNGLLRFYIRQLLMVQNGEVSGMDQLAERGEVL